MKRACSAPTKTLISGNFYAFGNSNLFCFTFPSKQVYRNTRFSNAKQLFVYPVQEPVIWTEKWIAQKSHYSRANGSSLKQCVTYQLPQKNELWWPSEVKLLLTKPTFFSVFEQSTVISSSVMTWKRTKRHVTWYFLFLSLSLQIITPLLPTVSMEKDLVHLELYTRNFACSANMSILRMPNYGHLYLSIEVDRHDEKLFLFFSLTCSPFSVDVSWIWKAVVLSTGHSRIPPRT